MRKATFDFGVKLPRKGIRKRILFQAHIDNGYTRKEAPFIWTLSLRYKLRNVTFKYKKAPVWNNRSSDIFQARAESFERITRRIIAEHYFVRFE